MLPGFFLLTEQVLMLRVHKEFKLNLSKSFAGNLLLLLQIMERTSVQMLEGSPDIVQKILKLLPFEVASRARQAS